MMPALTGTAGVPRALEYMLAYASYGFSVIPILAGTKKPDGLVLPNGQWAPFQQRRASVDEIHKWIGQRPDIGVAIVCGQVSGGLYCMDVDDTDFSLFIESNLEKLVHGGAWVVRTGSGKTHVWVRSRERVLTSHLIGESGKLADIRGDGQGNHGPSYIVAPPSTHPDTGREYESLAGSPEFVGMTSNARALFDKLRDWYEMESKNNHREAVLNGEPEDFDPGPSTERASPDDVESKRIESEVWSNIRLNRKTKIALTNGATPGEDIWAGADSRSEIDHYVIRDLRSAGMNIDQIERIFAWSKLGETGRYRDRKHGTYGRAYIALSLRNIDKDTARSQEAATKAAGANFAVERVIRIGYEEPVYEIYVRSAIEGKSGSVRLLAEDLMDEHRFKKAVVKALNFLPSVDPALMGRKFEKFGALLLAMAEPEPVPESATTSGHLRATVLAFISSEASPSQPEDPRMVTLGWMANSGAYVRGGAILQRLQNVIRPPVKPEQLWSVMRGLGGEEIGHKWSSGRIEMVWFIPLHRNGRT